MTTANDRQTVTSYSRCAVIMALSRIVLKIMMTSWSRDVFAVSFSWLCDTVVERRSVTGELSLFYARPAADG